MNNDPFAKLGAIDQMLFQKTPQKQAETILIAQQSPEKQEPPPSLSPSRKEKKKAEPAKQRDTAVSRHHDTTTPRHHDTTSGTVTPRHHDTIIETTRRAVKQLGKEAATHRFTVEEKKALRNIERAYEEKDIRTSENEITRISINYMLEEYRLHKEKSILARVLALLNS